MKSAKIETGNITYNESGQNTDEYFWASHRDRKELHTSDNNISVEIRILGNKELSEIVAMQTHIHCYDIEKYDNRDTKI
uniref:Uncharacterized protein n=1 Tax=Megaselia scalaris TaxID=36166 RepID=T1H5G9_MEGSC